MIFLYAKLCFEAVKTDVLKNNFFEIGVGCIFCSLYKFWNYLVRCVCVKQISLCITVSRYNPWQGSSYIQIAGEFLQFVFLGGTTGSAYSSGYHRWHLPTGLNKCFDWGKKAIGYRFTQIANSPSFDRRKTMMICSCFCKHSLEDPQNTDPKCKWWHLTR